MPKHDAPDHQQLLIQIDGLSRPVLEQAIADGDMPTLARLAADSEHELISVYPGLPSTTPAVQGELFYGVPCIVPAFAFVHARRTARHMVDPSAAGEVERTLRAKGGKPLLQDGSSYCNIYTAGARVSRFCPSEIAEPGEKLARGPIYTLRILGSYAGVGIRASGMLVGEIVRFAFMRRHKLKRAFRQTVQDTWDRIMLSVVLRDASRLAAKHDIARGLPIVCVNFLGYDKQAHRYGPRSGPARRTLKGIDTAIASLVDEIRECRGDNAMILVYSDHGQEETTSIQRLTGKRIERIVRDAVSGVVPDDPSEESTKGEDRATVKRGIAQEVGEQFLGFGASEQEGPAGYRLTTVEAGPIAHVYLDDRLTADHRLRIARRITSGAPGVAAICRDEDENLVGFVDGEESRPLRDFCLEKRVEHPFPDQLEGDIERLADHEDAGDVILFGAGFTGSPVTFPQEKGAHGGTGPEELHAFAIAPTGFKMAARTERSGPRFGHLRDAILEDRATNA